MRKSLPSGLLQAWLNQRRELQGVSIGPCGRLGIRKWFSPMMKPGLAELKALGARSVPISRRATSSTYAQSLKAIVDSSD